MRPWHRDVLAATGMLFIAGACFLVDLRLGLFVFGLQLLIAAVLLSVFREEEPENGA